MKYEYIKIPKNTHSIICTHCNRGWDLDLIKHIVGDCVYHTCPQCLDVLLTYPDIKENEKNK